MSRSTYIARALPGTVEDTLRQLGRNIRTARLRRNLTQAELAGRMGVSRFVVADIEKGKSTTGIAACLGALWALGLLAHMRDVAKPDRDDEGKALERARGPARAGRQRAMSDDF